LFSQLPNQNDFIIDVKVNPEVEIGQMLSLTITGSHSAVETGEFSCEVTIKSKCDSKALIEGDSRFMFEVS
jgi:hypothetical protein